MTWIFHEKIPKKILKNATSPRNLDGKLVHVVTNAKLEIINQTKLETI
jgi:hypothetical protein